MLLTLGPLQVKIKYTYTRGKTTYYQRAVPSDLHDRYPGKTIKKDLKTADPIRVARMVGTHPDRCVRIYFDYDESTQRCVVGWVGRHP